MTDFPQETSQYKWVLGPLVQQYMEKCRNFYGQLSYPIGTHPVTSQISDYYSNNNSYEYVLTKGNKEIVYVHNSEKCIGITLSCEQERQ